MPVIIFKEKVSGQEWEVEEKHLDKFARDYPDAITYQEYNGKTYRVPATKYNNFIAEKQELEKLAQEQGQAQQTQQPAPKVEYPVSTLADAPQDVREQLAGQQPQTAQQQVKYPVSTFEDAPEDVKKALQQPAEEEQPAQPQVDRPLTDEERIMLTWQNLNLLGQTQQAIEDFNTTYENRKEYSKGTGLLYEKDGTGMHNLGNLGKAVKSTLQLNPETFEVEQTYLTPYGNRYTDKTIADAESAQYYDSYIRPFTTPQRELRDLWQKRAKRIKFLEEELKETTKDWNAYQMGAGYGELYKAFVSNDKIVQMYDTAIKDTQKAIDELRRHKKRVDGDIKGAAQVFQGFWVDFSDISNWDMGITAIQDVSTRMNAIRIMEDENATDEQIAAAQALLEQAFFLQEAEELGATSKNGWYTAGGVTAMVLPYALDFRLTRSLSTGMKLASKGTIKLATKAYGKKAVQEMAEQGMWTYIKNNGWKGAGRYAGNWFIKATGETVDALVFRGSTRAATVGLGETMEYAFELKHPGVAVDEDGNFYYLDVRSWGSAFLEAFANSAIEYGSEELGEVLLPGLSLKRASELSDLMGARQLSKLLAAADADELGVIVRNTRKFLNKMGIQGLPEEAGEEYIGQALRSLLGLESAYTEDEFGNRINLFQSGQFNRELWAGLTLSMGVMHGFGWGFTSAQYSSLKHRVSKADTKAEAVFGRQTWNFMRNSFDNTTNEDIGKVAEAIVLDREMTTEQKEAALDYLGTSLEFRGFNLASTAQSRGEKVDEDVAEANASYLDGYHTSTPEEMNNIKHMYEVQQQRMRMQGAADDVINNYSIDKLIDLAKYFRQQAAEHDQRAAEMMNYDETFDYANSEKQASEQALRNAQVVMDYVNAKQVYEGMMQRVRDDIDWEIEKMRATTDLRTNKDSGMMEHAVLKEGDRGVFIVSGKVAVLDDGTVDLSTSDSSIIIRDEKTGKLEQVSPNAIFFVDKTIDPEKYKAQTEKYIRDRIAQEAADSIDGKVTFNEGDSYTLTAPDGTQTKVTVTANDQGVVDNGDGTVNVTDGNKVVALPKTVIQEQVDKQNKQKVEEFERERQAQNEAARQTARQSRRQRRAARKQAKQQQQQQQQQPKREYKINDNVTLRRDDGEIVHGEIVSVDKDGIVVYVDKPINGQRAAHLTPEQIGGMLVEHNGESVGQQNEYPVSTMYYDAPPQPEQPASPAPAAPEAPGKTDAENATVKTKPDKPDEPQPPTGGAGAVVEDQAVPEQAAPAQTEQSVPTEQAPGQATEPTVGQSEQAGPTQATPAQQTEPQQPQTALERIPKDEQGQPLYEQTDSDTAWDALVEQTGGDAQMAQEVAESMLADKEAALKKLERSKVKSGGGVTEKIAAATERKNAIEQAKREVEAWRNIAQTPARRQAAIKAQQAAEQEAQRQAAQEAARARREQEKQERAAREEAERQRREALNGVPDFVDDTPQDARARGYRRVSGQKVDRQAPLTARKGKRVQVKFNDKNIPGGRVALIEAKQLQPSHINGYRNPNHFIDEAQPKERNDKASVMSASKIAANIRPEEITSSVTAYTGAPTVNTRGEVIQGNNRSAALREMWESEKEQAQKYKQYLIEHAADFGLTAEDVEAMQQPVLVNMLDVTDEEAITLGQFVAQDTESGGTERIKPKNMVRKMGEDMRTYANMLLESTDDEMSFAELVDRNGVEVLKWMQAKGYITPTQYRSAFDSKGNLTAEAKNDLKGIMYQSIFQDGTTLLEEMFNSLPAKAQKAILATAYRDYDSPNTERLIGEIQDSIRAYYALSQEPEFASAKNYKDARMAAETWKRQLAFDDVTYESYLPSEKYSNFALLLATMYKGQTQTFIQGTFTHIYDLVQGTQEETLFEKPDNTPRSLAEAINEAINARSDKLLLNENFEYDGQRRSNVLGSSTATSQQGRPGSTGNAQARERTEEGTGTADNRDRTATSGAAREGRGEESNDSQVEGDSASKQEKQEKYTLSSKQAENGESFYQDSNGNIDLVDIPQEVFDEIGYRKAPFRLTSSMIHHVLEGHGKELGISTVDEAVSFVLNVLTNFDHVRSGNDGALIFSIENNRGRIGKRAITILLNSDSGEFYGLKTSGYESIKGLIKRPLLWERGANQSSTTDAASASVTSGQSSISGEQSGSASHQSKSHESRDDASANEDTESSQTDNSSEEKVSTENQSADFVAPERQEGESTFDYAERVAKEYEIHRARKKVNTNPTESQKKQTQQATEESSATEPQPTPAQTTEQKPAKKKSQSRKKEAGKTQLHESKGKRAAMTRSQRKVFDTVMDLLKKAGIKVEILSDEQMRELAGKEGKKGVRLLSRKKKAPETDSILQGEHQRTVISDAAGAKVLKNLGKLAKEYDESAQTKEKTFIGSVAKAIGAKRYGSKSQYATFETKNGKIVTIRLSDHNASTKNFDNAGRDNGISIIISSKKNAGINNDGDAHIVEFYYDAISLRKASGKPLAEIVRSIQQALYSGEFKDTTELAVREEVNARQEDGDTVYGAVKDGTIYLNESALNPETPLHEYTHLWDEACRQSNPELWRRGVELLKQTPVWEEVKNDPNYADLRTDDEIASEVHSRLSGQEGAAMLEAMAEEEARKTGKAVTKKSLVERLRGWLRDFYTWLRSTMMPWTKGQASNIGLREFVNMPLADLVRGTDVVSEATQELGIRFQIGSQANTDVRYRSEGDQKHRDLAREIYDSVLRNDYNDVLLQQINDYIDESAPDNPYGRQISQRLPQKSEREMHERHRTNAVDALYTRIAESAVGSSGKKLAGNRSQRERTKEKKKELLKQWAIATGNWHTSVSDFTNDTEPIARGKDSDVYKSKEEGFVVKFSKGKSNTRFPSDIDAVNLFNFIFPSTAYDILGYGEIDGQFVTILQQPTVFYTSALTEEERVEYMRSHGFKPINDENTAFSNGEIVVSDLQKANILHGVDGETYVIDADVKLHTKDVGGNYTYPPASVDTESRSYGSEVVEQSGSESQQRQGDTTTNEQSYAPEAITPDTLSGRNEMAKQVTELAEKLNLPNVEVVTSVSGLEGEKATAKGFYDPQTGKITVVIPNNANVTDAVQTLLHEAVAHFGLRQLFGENFDTFLDNVFENADIKVRRSIAELASKKGWNFRKATEEYLASLAETTNFEQAQNSSWWQKIKDFFVQMFDKLGLPGFKGTTLSDNELRYILWRSYENLRQSDPNSLLARAADIAMQYELGVGQYSNDVLYRDGSPEMREQALVRDRYEQRMRSGWYQSWEAMQDSMLSLKEFMTMVAGKRTYIEDIAGFQNAYLGENRLSSVNKAEADAYAHLLFKPLLDEVARLARTGAARRELTDYMFAKHGLERNRVMAERDAQKAFEEYQKKHPNGTKTLQDFIDEFRQKDYAGLTALTGYEDVAEAEMEAERMVSEYEDAHDTATLWERVNAANKAILSKSYESGFMSKEVYDNISSMYEYYIPLRGFDQKTSAEAYAYLNDKHSAFNAPYKKTEGRKSKAADPLAYMQSMAESVIAQGNRNTLVKQKFLNFVLNNPSDLVSVNQLWVQYDEVADEWKPVFPDNIGASDSAAEVERKMQEFEERMKQLAEAQPDKYKKGREAANIPYRVVTSNDLHQHQVVVKRGGVDYVLTINGNPRLAQALNGQTNPSVDDAAKVNLWEKARRWKSAIVTTYTPEFMVGNFQRDGLYSNIMAWLKEGANYGLRYNYNFVRVNPYKIIKLLRKYDEGTLDMNNKTEEMFHDFIMNGGETGYTNIRNIEKHKSDINRELNKIKQQNNRIPVRKAFEFLKQAYEDFNRGIEGCSRFAAFVTSREMGRTIDRSIYDAKEITVNFNKKGAGGKFVGAQGQTALGNTVGAISAYGRSTQVFWNPGVQGAVNFLRPIWRHKGRGAALIGGIYFSGVLQGILGYMGDDDDDENSYANMSDHIRRNNLLFRAGDHWIRISLPHEFRPFFALGELTASALMGKERSKTTEELAWEIAAMTTQVMPIDPLEGDKSGGTFALNAIDVIMPSVLEPFWEAWITKKDWTGMPLFKDNEWNEDMPKWTKAYSSTNKQLVDLYATLNEATGGDKYMTGWWNWNPAVTEHILEGYLGGFWTTASRLGKTAATITGEREYDPRNIFLLNRVVAKGSDRTEYRAVNEEYYRLKDEYELTNQRLKGYENEANQGVLKYADKLNFLYNSPEYLRYQIFDGYKPFIDNFYNALKDTEDAQERKELEAALNQLKKAMIVDMELSYDKDVTKVYKQIGKLYKSLQKTEDEEKRGEIVAEIEDLIDEDLNELIEAKVKEMEEKWNEKGEEDDE